MVFTVVSDVSTVRPALQLLVDNSRITTMVAEQKSYRRSRSNRPNDGSHQRQKGANKFLKENGSEFSKFPKNKKKTTVKIFINTNKFSIELNLEFLDVDSEEARNFLQR